MREIASSFWGSELPDLCCSLVSSFFSESPLSSFDPFLWFVASPPDSASEALDSPFLELLDSTLSSIISIFFFLLLDLLYFFSFFSAFMLFSSIFSFFAFFFTFSSVAYCCRECCSSSILLWTSGSSLSFVRSLCLSSLRVTLLAERAASDEELFETDALGLFFSNRMLL